MTTKRRTLSDANKRRIVEALRFYASTVEHFEGTVIDEETALHKAHKLKVELMELSSLINCSDSLVVIHKFEDTHKKSAEPADREFQAFGKAAKIAKE